MTHVDNFVWWLRFTEWNLYVETIRSKEPIRWSESDFSALIEHVLAVSISKHGLERPLVTLLQTREISSQGGIHF